MKQYNLSILLLRPLLILSIIVGHGFAIYSGSWEIPYQIINVDGYQYVNIVFISFQLQCFVFISGFLSGKSYTRLNVDIRKRFKRIMYPSIFWSVIYPILFEKGHLISISSFCHLFSGNGHLWFLPMLFGCYLIAILLRKMKLHPVVILILALIMMLLSFPLPYPLSILVSIASFYIYYELGMCVSKLIADNYNREFSYMVYVLIPLFILSFVLYIKK